MPQSIDREFAGKVAFVTGAGSGIGRATALAFAHAGANVTIADISQANLEATAAALERSVGESSPCCATCPRAPT